MAINDMYSIFKATDKCYCKHTNGRNLSEINGIMCGKNGSFIKTGHCGSGEFCIGTSNASDAILKVDKEALCAKGNLKYMKFTSCSLMLAVIWSISAGVFYIILLFQLTLALTTAGILVNVHWYGMVKNTNPRVNVHLHIEGKNVNFNLVSSINLNFIFTMYNMFNKTYRTACNYMKIIIVFLDYTIMDNMWCGKQKDGEYASLFGAKNACDLEADCTMFFDFESKNEKYVLCGSVGDIKFSTIFRSRLYVKHYIECKSVLNITH